MEQFKNWLRLELSSQNDQVFKDGHKIKEESAKHNLAAEIRDPVWFLYRQWQFGEFQGEDAATPAYVTMNYHSASMTEILDRDTLYEEAKKWISYDMQAAPLEVFIEGERIIPKDLASAAELGQWLEKKSTNNNNSNLITFLRKVYPIPTLPLLNGCKLFNATKHTILNCIYEHQADLTEEDNAQKTYLENILDDFLDQSASSIDPKVVRAKQHCLNLLELRTVMDLEMSAILCEYFETLVTEEFGLNYLEIATKLSKAFSFSKELVRFTRVCGGYAINGVSLFLDIVDEAAPWQKIENKAIDLNDPRLVIPSIEDAQQVNRILRAFVKHVQKSYGLSFDDSTYAWQGENLEYRAGVRVNHHQMSLEPNHLGEIEWYSLDSFAGYQLPAPSTPLDGIKFLRAISSRSKLARLAHLVNARDIKELIPVFEHLLSKLLGKFGVELGSEIEWEFNLAREIGAFLEESIDGLPLSGKNEISISVINRREVLKKKLHAMFPLQANAIIPAHVKFKGMPNARWWQFENSETSFGDIWPDERELAKLALIDFMLIQSNDWLVIPLMQTLGTIQSVNLKVCDVFGNTTIVKPFESSENKDDQSKWSLFNQTIITTNEGCGLNSFLAIPPSVTSSVQKSTKIEEVQFIRDEMANLVWAIESEIEGFTGLPIPIYERENDTGLNAVYRYVSQEGMPFYQRKSDVPHSWIPYGSVRLDQSTQEVALKRNDKVNFSSTILEDSVKIREEEVARTGIKVTRIVNRSRWIDGSTHVWISRRKNQGTGSKNSGLRFDFLSH